ncbi:MAG: hypothetical protein U0166_22755 [Acidobacteriota bacterium]
MEALAFEAMGVRVSISAEGPDVLDRVRSLLLPGWHHGATGSTDARLEIRGGRAAWSLAEGDDRLFEAGDLEAVLLELERIVHNRVADLAADRLCLHAGVVGIDGAAVLIPGSSHSGKSTLVRALVRAGATYYSDDNAPIDRDGLVHPYPRKLSLRGARPRRLPAEPLGWHEALPPLPVRLVVLTAFREGCSFMPVAPSPGRAALALFRHAVSARRNAEWALPLLAAVARRARILAGPRGEASDAAARILERCA